MTGRLMMRQICNTLNLPWNDVDVALAQVQPVQIKNARWYDTMEAAVALESYYWHKASENEEHFMATGSKVYHKRASISAERLARIREYIQRLEVERNADHVIAGNH